MKSKCSQDICNISNFFFKYFSGRYKTTLHVETILATIEDYNNDFTHIMPE